MDFLDSEKHAINRGGHVHRDLEDLKAGEYKGGGEDLLPGGCAVCEGLPRLLQDRSRGYHCQP